MGYIFGEKRKWSCLALQRYNGLPSVIVQKSVDWELPISLKFDTWKFVNLCIYPEKMNIESRGIFATFAAKTAGERQI